MPRRDIIVIGASAGGVEALQQLVGGFPRDLGAAVFVTVHVPANAPSVLPQILSRHGPLPAVTAVDNQVITVGRIYVAPPDLHLLIKRGHIRTTKGPRENGHRPSVDPLFRTAAKAYGPRVIGVILSGNLDDGTAGLAAIKERGGLAVVQDPEDAYYPGMPSSAIAHVPVDHVCTLADLPELLADLVGQPVSDATIPPPSPDMQVEADMAELKPQATHNPERPGVPSGFACPECGGSLFEHHDSDLLRFRCRIGHAFSPETLLAEQEDQLEEALWVALRALEENAALAQRLTERMAKRGDDRTAGRFKERAQSSHAQAEYIRRLLLGSTRTQTAEAEQSNRNSQSDSAA